jgi:hypothetical protein
MTGGVGVVSSKNPEWHLTAIDDEAVYSASKESPMTIPRPSEGPTPTQEEVSRRSLMYRSSAENLEGDYSSYEMNMQWALHAMGCTTLNAGEPGERYDPPTWVIVDGSGNPYEGSGTKIGWFTLLGPGYSPTWLTPGETNPYDDVELHPAFDYYRTHTDSSELVEADFTEDPAADELDADGGYFGYSIAADQEKTFELDQGDGVTTTVPSFDQTYPIAIWGFKILPGSVLLESTAGAAAKSLTDDGAGNLTGDGSGTINYTTGVVTADWTTAPDDTTIVYGSFQNAQPTQLSQIGIDQGANCFSGWAMGLVSSRSVGADTPGAATGEVPKSQVQTKTTVKGRIRGLAPRTTMIGYSALGAPTDPQPVGNFPIGSLIASIYKAIEHKCQVFVLAFNALAFYGQIPNWQDLIREAILAAKSAGMLLLGSAGFQKVDHDRSRSALRPWNFGDFPHVLMVGGTGPRDYDAASPDLSDFTPDPERSPQPATRNLDRMALFAINYTGLGFIGFNDFIAFGGGSGETNRMDLCAPTGGMSIEDAKANSVAWGWLGLIPAVSNPNLDSGVLGTSPFPGAVHSITIWAAPFLNTSAKRDTWGPHGVSFYDSGAVGHAAGAALLALEAYKDKNASFPTAQRVKNLLQLHADERIGPPTDFSTISAPPNSRYKSDTRYTLFYDATTDEIVDDFWNGNRNRSVFDIAGAYAGLSLWYSYEHPSDPVAGRDPAYGKGRINIKTMVDAIIA